jgi:DNA-binding Lrp family transcriptional regulator
MQASHHIENPRYAKCVQVSKRVRWDIDRDVIRGRRFDFDRKFLPDGLSQVDRIDFLSDSEKRLLSQIQGRTYANIFGLVERFINAKILEASRDHWFGDQSALEALVRFSDEELKHQELFRRIERLAAEGMPEGYTFMPDPNDVAAVVLGKSTWAVLGLTCHIELFTQAHYRESIDPDDNLSGLYKDVFLYHWKEESQHAILDELEWRREDAKLTPEARDRAVDDLIALVGAVDGILQAQSKADADCFVRICGREMGEAEAVMLERAVLQAYRWQYILSGVQEPRFTEILASLITEGQGRRIAEALVPITGASH